MNKKKSKQNSALNKWIAGMTSLTSLAVFGTLISTYITTSGYGTLATLVLVVITWNLTLRKLEYDPDAKKIAEAQKQWAEQEKEKLIKFTSESANYINSDSFVGRYLGGSGNNYEKNAEVIIGQGKDCIYFGYIDKQEHKTIAIENINLFEISGEGTVTTNAGVVGGGLGVEGFIKGAVVAEIVNKATSKTTTNTFIRIMTSESELYFHTSEREPAHLQILFSKVFVHINAEKTRKTNSTGISDELVKLHSLLKDGVLTQAEFETAKRNLLEG